MHTVYDVYILSASLYGVVWVWTEEATDWGVIAEVCHHCTV